ncbi:hypothetical protein [Alkalihalobacillus deserti]|uniref:hypothetical protein n=1 Tax=Alkalihalobacillus deserti TaxID=2879466 RepID=UPI001D157099|nr:hypothetical protein [Alkalihalobacillus deserti]
MKRSKFIGIGVILMCIIIGTFVFYIQFNQSTELVDFNKIKPKEVKQLEEKLSETELMLEIGEKLYEKRYTFGLEWEVLSKEKVDIVVKLPKEEISEDTINEVKQIVNEVVTANNIEPQLFEIEVKNYPKVDN